MAQAIYGEPLSGDPFTDRRRTGIGGSDTGGILGVSPFSSAMAVWEEKRGIHSDFTPSERMVWGTRLETAILHGYGEDHQLKVRRGRFTRSKAHPIMVGHPDGWASKPGSDQEILIEIKAVAHLDEQWGPDDSDQVPAHYFSQVQHYLIVTGAEEAHLVVLKGGGELHRYIIRADPDFHAALISEEAAFWELVKAGTPPAPDGSESAAKALRRLYPEARPVELEAPPEMEELMLEHMKARAAESQWGKLGDVAGQRIQDWMGEAAKATSPTAVASWPNRKGTMIWRDVAAVFRDLLVRYAPLDDDQLDEIMEAQRGKPTRSFSVKAP